MIVYKLFLLLNDFIYIDVFMLVSLHKIKQYVITRYLISLKLKFFTLDI